MKINALKIIFFLLSGCLFFSLNYGQEEVKGTKQKLEINLDELGDAEIKLNMKLNASQWDMFKKTIGNNPAYLKREMIKGMPTVYLTDFTYEEDPMERSYTLGMKGLAAAQQNDKGKWEAELDMKDPEIMKINDQQLRLDLNMLSNGVFVEQIQMINLPKNAKNAQIEKDSFGNAVLTYETGGGMSGMLTKGLGVLLVLGGAFLGFKNSKSS